jgi:hypothetical protein
MRTAKTNIHLFAAVSAILMIAVNGCSSKVAGPQKQVSVVNGIAIEASIRPGLPQDSGSDSPTDSAQTGDNTLVVQLRDSDNNDPITDANITAAPSTDLVGDQRAESGRAQGNGLYYVPIRFGVPDDYKVIVTVQRPGQKNPTTALFHFSVN